MVSGKRGNFMKKRVTGLLLALCLCLTLLPGTAGAAY